MNALYVCFWCFNALMLYLAVWYALISHNDSEDRNWITEANEIMICVLHASHANMRFQTKFLYSCISSSWATLRFWLNFSAFVLTHSWINFLKKIWFSIYLCKNDFSSLKMQWKRENGCVYPKNINWWIQIYICLLKLNSLCYSSIPFVMLMPGFVQSADLQTVASILQNATKRRAEEIILSPASAMPSALPFISSLPEASSLLQVLLLTLLSFQRLRRYFLKCLAVLIC